MPDQSARADTGPTGSDGLDEVGLAAAQRAVAAVLERAGRDGHLVAVAVVDRAGDLVAFARADGGVRRWVRHAQRKAYTAATMGRTTRALGEELRRRGMTVAEYGDPAITTLPGGAPWGPRRGVAAGAVGVAGNGGADADEALAQLGVEVLRAE